ncbi:carbohydrate ABC transporter permease [Brachybacterium nesterenkovii]|uniref:carbohydrate ABC transporter permease n=1 Tax=Brachybacterium nesterenkovii TaxID=47847 RepID=UPI00321B626B
MSATTPPSARTRTRAASRGAWSKLRGSDKATVLGMSALPVLLVGLLVWLPALITVVLSFTRWDGIGGLEDIEFIGLRNYTEMATIYPAFWPALWHNLLWLAGLFLVFTPLGMLLAILLDRELRGTTFYQTALYLPVVLSTALIGFIWQLMYSADQGFINAVLGTSIDFYGDPGINLYAAMLANGWRHTGYIMLLYLAGLKGFDKELHEASALDGAGPIKTFFLITFPVMRPTNILILVITFIEGLRAFDLVWVINRGTNGLEMISTLVTANVAGEASRIGFGSALATVMLLLSSVFIIIQTRLNMKDS